MFGIQNYGAFLFAILLFQLIPGAGSFAILNATARNGIGAGIGAVFGTLCGDLDHMLVSDPPGRHWVIYRARLTIKSLRTSQFD